MDPADVSALCAWEVADVGARLTTNLAGLALTAVLLTTGCFGYTLTKETGTGATPGSGTLLGDQGDEKDGASGSGAGSGAGSGDATSTASTATSLDFDRAEIERRLALAPFAYVAETDVNPGAPGQGAAAATHVAAFAMVDSVTDTLASRPECVSQPIDVAVAPDGSRVYVTDWGRPVIHVLDAETRAHLRDIPLPGVTAPDMARLQKYATDGVMNPQAKVPWDWGEGCSGGIAVTPDGSYLIVTTQIGLMVVDAAEETVVRVFPDLHAETVAVSFDGRRAYLGTSDFATREARPMLEWINLRNEGVGGGLTLLDLETWKVLLTREIGHVNGIAVKPDDTEVYVSDHAKKALHMVDALTLEDRGLIVLGTSFPVGVGILPDGSKAYVVCSADTTDIYASVAQRSQVSPPTAEEYFCAVIDVDSEEVVKRIPLQSY